MDSSNSSDSEIEEHEHTFDWYRPVSNRQDGIIRNNHAIQHNSISPWNKENDGITTLYRCEASEAKVLYIFDSAYKLQQNDHYDIGGAYTDNDTGLWFYFTTLSGPGRNYLMNIFVCQRKPGMYSVGISNSNNLNTVIYNNERVRMMNDELYWQKFCTTQPDEVNYVKTFCFSEEDRVSLHKMVLIIPISINMCPVSMLNRELVEKIKTELEFGEKLLKDQKPNFILKSGEGKDFKVHKIFLAAHSPVLRDLIRAEDCNMLTLDITDYEIRIMLEYLYTGIIKDILNQKLEILLVMADKFQLKNLTQLVKQAMKVAISSENALAIAVVAEKYNCKDIQEVAFKYIAQHPEVLDSDAFSEINNTNVVKKLLKYVHVKK